VLKNVKLPFLNYKRINLPIENQMNRVLVIFAFFFAGCFTACTKSALYGSTQVKAEGKLEDDSIQKYIAANGLTGIAKRVQNNDTIGVYYVIINDTAKTKTLYTASTQVTVGYTAKLLTKGTTIYQTNVFHPSYALSSVIRAWQLGIPEINVGDEVRLIVPSRYAYGHYPPTGTGIPPDTILDFYITLYNATN
jgi:FKBP-type peptidyl-prolyl cis-trans isomerase FkpA